VDAVSGLTREILDRARRSRDARFDGRFFIAVRSTRIYCRPICPSRFSHDSNIRYYATAEQAAEAGYRPCLRCRPEAAPGSPAWTGTSAVVQRALRLIQDGALDWEHICRYLAKVAIPGVEVVTARSYARAVRTPSGHAVLQIRPVARQHALQVRIQGAMPAELPRLLSSVRRMFDLTADPAHVTSTLLSDPLLRPAIALRPGLRIPGAWDPFECTISALVSQRVAFAPRIDLLERLVERFGEPIEPVVPGVHHLFPSPAVLADANLIRSRSRANVVRPCGN
jgi:hypothetical protein